MHTLFLRCGPICALIMARPERKYYTGFPVYKLSLRMAFRVSSDNIDEVDRYKAIRSIANGFIAKPDIRELIFKRDNYQCLICNSDKNLTIDHVISVLACYHDHISIEKLNHQDNLDTLCKSCNSAKLP